MSFAATVLSGVVSLASPTIQPNKNVVNNNAAASVSCYQGLNAYTGTMPTTVAFNFPAAAAAADGTVVTVTTQAAVSVSSTWASVGATFVGAPATLAALAVVRFTYNAASTQWIIS